MNILSLFDGMACGMLAMLEAGVKVDRYVAYEIDKYAVQTSAHNFPMIEQRGDVFQADFTEFAGFDWLVGGSPCTYWSIAQKNNRETEASGMGWELFSQYVRALREAKPMYFIYENNKSMSKAIRQSITETFGFDAICINSALVSAQNRQRLYWVGKRNEDGTYSKVEIEQPENRGILLRDILESGQDLTSNDKEYCLTASYDGACAWNTIERSQRTMVSEPVGIGYRGRMYNGKWVKQYESNGTEKTNAITTAQTDSMVAEPVAINTTDDGDKARTLMAGYYKYGTATLITNEGFKGGTTAVAEPCRAGCYPSPDGTIKNSQGMRIYSVDGKSVNITAQGGGMGAKTGLCSIPVRVGDLPNSNGKITKSQGRRIYSVEGKSVCISCGASGGNTDMNSSATGLYAIPIEFDGEKPIKAISAADGKTYTVYEVKDGQITIKGKTYPIKLADGFYIIRKLTVRECMRLQTVPEWYEFPVSDSQAYKMLGNGWTVSVISHLILSALQITP